MAKVNIWKWIEFLRWIFNVCALKASIISRLRYYNICLFVLHSPQYICVWCACLHDLMLESRNWRYLSHDVIEEISSLYLHIDLHTYILLIMTVADALWAAFPDAKSSLFAFIDISLYFMSEWTLMMMEKKIFKVI